MSKPFLRAEQRNHLGARIERHAVTARIPRGDSVRKGLGIADRVDVIMFVARRLAQRVDDVRRGRDIRRADAQIDHMTSLRKLFFLHVEQDRKNSNAKTVHALCEFHRQQPLFSAGLAGPRFSFYLIVSAARHDRIGHQGGGPRPRIAPAIKNRINATHLFYHIPPPIPRACLKNRAHRLSGFES